MTVRIEGNTVRLDGVCHVEDAEPLLIALQASPTCVVDVSTMVSLHTAVLQILLRFGATVQGSGGDAFTERWVTPLLSMAATE